VENKTNGTLIQDAFTQAHTMNTDYAEEFANEVAKRRLQDLSKYLSQAMSDQLHRLISQIPARLYLCRSFEEPGEYGLMIDYQPLDIALLQDPSTTVDLLSELWQLVYDSSRIEMIWLCGSDGTYRLSAEQTGKNRIRLVLSPVE
jgi:hypothetical protein